MTNKPRVNVNFKKLESEFFDAQTKEERYDRENAAKFRAIAQKVPTYEDFSEIVKASHLKPLEKKDSITTAACTTVWNCAYDPRVNSPGHQETTSSQSGRKSWGNELPRNQQQFTNSWRTIDSLVQSDLDRISMKFSLFLAIYRGQLFPVIWKGGFSALSDFIGAAHALYVASSESHPIVTSELHAVAAAEELEGKEHPIQETLVASNSIYQIQPSTETRTSSTDPVVPSTNLVGDESPSTSTGQSLANGHPWPLSRFLECLGELLACISTLSRHSLELQFLSRADKSQLAILVGQVLHNGHLDSSEMDALKKAYPLV